MSGFKDRIERTKHFLQRDIWETELRKLPRWRRVLLQPLLIAMIVYREFISDRCLLRASALTYFSVLSIVPLFAMTFALLKGFGVQKALEPILLERIAVGSEEIVSHILRYIENTNFGSLGAIGLLTLIVTVLALLTNIEQAFNDIWGVNETRAPFRRFADYFSVLMFAPLFLLIAISMTTTLESHAFVLALMERAFVGEFIISLFRILPYIAMWAAFIFLYIFMPNIKVDFRAAVIGGILGGTLWQLAQWGYITFQVGVSRYNAIYGTLAALPILMMWIYISWLIVLFGVEVTYALQNKQTILREIRDEKINFVSWQMAAIAILVLTTKVFYRGDPPLDPQKISAALNLPPRMARKTLDELVRLGFLSEVRHDRAKESAYQPARPPDELTVFEVWQTMREDGVMINLRELVPEWEAARHLEEKFQEAEGQAVNGMTILQLTKLEAKPEG
jgi:membrane protein